MLRDMEKKDIFFVQIVWHKEVIQPLYYVITLYKTYLAYSSSLTFISSTELIW